MRRVKYISVLLLLLKLTMPIQAQDLSITLKLDTGVIYIGDQINMYYEVDLPKELNLGVVMPNDSLQKDIEILKESEPVTTSIDDNSKRVSGSFLITSFTEGLNRISAPHFIISKGERDTIIDTKDLELWVNRTEMTPTDSTQVIFDIVAPLKEPVTFVEIAPYIAIILALALAIWAFLRFIVPMIKKRDKALEPEQIEPAHVLALRKLTALKNKELWQNGELKGYYSELSEILRDYLDNRFGLNTMEQTTGEIMKALGKGGIVQSDQKSKLSDILIVSDMVKFAKGTPDAGVHESVYRNAWDFVSSTREEKEVSEVEQKSDVK